MRKQYTDLKVVQSVKNTQSRRKSKKIKKTNVHHNDDDNDYDDDADDDDDSNHEQRNENQSLSSKTKTKSSSKKNHKSSSKKSNKLSSSSSSSSKKKNKRKQKKWIKQYNISSTSSIQSPILFNTPSSLTSPKKKINSPSILLPLPLSISSTSPKKSSNKKTKRRTRKRRRRRRRQRRHSVCTTPLSASVKKNNRSTVWMGIYDDETVKIEQQKRRDDIDSSDELELRGYEQDKSFQLYSETPFIRDYMNHDALPLVSNYVAYNNEQRIKYNDVSQIQTSLLIQSRIQKVMNLPQNKKKSKYFNALSVKLKSQINKKHSFYMRYKKQLNDEKKHVYNPVFFFNQINKIKDNPLLTNLKPVGTNSWTLDVWKKIKKLDKDVFAAQQYYIIARSLQSTKWSTWHFGYLNVTQILPLTSNIVGYLNQINDTTTTNHITAINDIACQYIPPILTSKFGKPWQHCWYVRRIVCYICGAIVPTKNYWKQWKSYWYDGDTNTSLVWCWICAQVAHRCHINNHLQKYHFDEWNFIDDKKNKQKINKRLSFRCCPCRYLHSMIDIVPSESVMDFSPIPQSLINKLCIHQIIA